MSADENQNEAETVVALEPAYGADSQAEIERFIPCDIRDLYDVYSYKHAAAILVNSATAELDEIFHALRSFRLSCEWLKRGGGNESFIPKEFSRLLRPKGWFETRITGDLILKLEIHEEGVNKETVRKSITRANYLSGHKIDYIKNRVAFDLEWNSKDQTFDRDLFAMRTFAEYGIISAGVIVTRAVDLNGVFGTLGLKSKYGASTTWMGKLLPRMNAGRNGGCPVLIFGITKKLISDWNE